MITAKGLYFVKQPTDVLSYSLPWAPFLGSDTIANSTWAASVPAGLTLTNDSVDGTNTEVFIADGEASIEYLLSNTIVTAGGRTKTRTFYLQVGSITLASNALLSIEYLKTFLKRLREAPDDDVENLLLAQLCNGISDRIIRYCDRNFAAANYVERVDVTEELVVRNNPILYVSGIYMDTQPAINLVNAAANMTTALAWVAPDRKLYLRVVGGASNGTQTIDLTATASDTLSELVAAINALATGWTASLCQGRTGYELCEDLVESTPLRIYAPGAPLKMLGDPCSLEYQIDYGAGIVRFQQSFEQAGWLPDGFQPLGSRQAFGDDLPTPTGWVKYRGGYETIPAGLQLLAAKIAAHTYSTPQDGSLTSEKIGEYSYNRSLNADMDKSVMSFATELDEWRNLAV